MHWLFGPLSRIDVQVYDLAVTEFDHPRVDFMIKEARATIDRYFDVVELSDREAGVVYKHGRVAGLLAPPSGRLHLFPGSGGFAALHLRLIAEVPPGRATLVHPNHPLT